MVNSSMKVDGCVLTEGVMSDLKTIGQLFANNKFLTYKEAVEN